MTQVRVTYIGVEGQGNNLTAAKMDAAQKAEDMLKGSYTPSLISFDKLQAFVWREPFGGWHYQLTNDKRERMYGTGGYADEDKCIRSAIYHMAQNSFDVTDSTSGARIMELLTFDSDKRDFISWAKWQYSYRELRAEGKTDYEAHQLAKSY